MDFPEGDNGEAAPEAVTGDSPEGSTADNSSADAPAEEPLEEAPPAEDQKQQTSSPEDESLLLFLSNIKKHLSEQIRFHHLRLLSDGVFVDEPVIPDLITAFEAWYKSYASEEPSVTLPTEEKLRKRILSKLSKETKYLLDGKTVLCGRQLLFESSSFSTSDIPRFQGSLLDAQSYIHMRDPIFEQTKGVSAKVGPRGLQVEVNTRKHPLTFDNAQLQKLAKTIQESRATPKRFSKVQYAARQAIPAFCEMWKKAQSIPQNTRLLVPQRASEAKKAWFLLFGDLIFVQDESGELLSVYGLRGKALHNFLIEETELLRKQKRRPRFGTMNISAKGRGYGFIKLDGDGYLLDPVVVRKFIERMPFSRDIPEKVPPRFTLSDALKRVVALIESTAWVDAIHVPKGFAQEHPQGTNYRSKGPWYFAINKKKQIVALFDRNDPTTRHRGQDDGRKRSNSLIGIGSLKKRGHQKHGKKDHSTAQDSRESVAAPTSQPSAPES